MDYSIDFCEEYFLVTSSGMAEVKVFGDIFDAVCNHEKWQLCSSYIVDHSDLNVSQMNQNDIKQIAAITRKMRSVYKVDRSAVVVPQDHGFGLSRMWLVHVGDEGEINTSIFRTRKEAIEWITAEAAKQLRPV